MKLKKIASLMLAGIMAVSMLAGCNGGAPIDDDDNGVDGGVVGLSNEVEALIDDKNDEYVPGFVTFKNDPALDAALNAAAGYAIPLDVTAQYVEQRELTGVDTSIYDVLVDKTGADDPNNGGVSIGTIGTYDVLKAAELGEDYKMDDVIAVDMTAISGAMSEDAVKEKVAAKIMNDCAMANWLNALASKDKEHGGNFNYTYTVSVSMCEKTVNDSFVGTGSFGGDKLTAGLHGAAAPSVTFVAIQVVRTATHQ